MANKDLNRLLRAAEQQDWRVVPKKKGWLLLAPNGTDKVMIHKTASDIRAIDNAIALMRGAGFEWEGR